MNIVLANWKLGLSGLSLIAYIMIQHRLYLSLMKACSEFKKALETGNVEDAGGFTWLKNVRTMFAQADGTWLENSPLPRDAVIDSLDNEIWRTSRYGALQRWGLAAPLLGVILSALGFMVSPPELTGEVRDVMGKLGPLFLGVFVGALMALVNQIYLHYSAVELGRVRAKAVLWFDQVIWKAIRQGATNALGQATSATQSAAKYLETSSSQLATCNITYRDSLLELNRQLAQVREAAQTTSTTFDTFSTTFGEMTEQIRSSIKNLTALNATASAVENSGAVWTAAAEKVGNASTAIEDSSKSLLASCGNFTKNFDDVGQSMKEGVAQSTDGLLTAVNQLAEPIVKLEGSISQMRTNTDRHNELATALTSSVKQADQFLMERMALNADEADLQREMAKRVKASIESLKEFTETAASVGNTGAALNQAASGLTNASTTIDSALKTLLDSCNAFSTRCADLQNHTNAGVEQTSLGLQTAAQQLVDPIQALNASIARVSTSTDRHAELSERLEAATQQAERMVQDRIRANAEEAARVKQIDGMEKRLGETARILADSVTGMIQLQRSLDTLVGEIRMERAGKDAGRSGWLSWMSKPRPANALSAPNGVSDEDKA